MHRRVATGHGIERPRIERSLRDAAYRLIVVRALKRPAIMIGRYATVGDLPSITHAYFRAIRLKA